MRAFRCLIADVVAARRTCGGRYLSFGSRVKTRESSEADETLRPAIKFACNGTSRMFSVWPGRSGHDLVLASLSLKVSRSPSIVWMMYWADVSYCIPKAKGWTRAYIVPVRAAHLQATVTASGCLQGDAITDDVLKCVTTTPVVCLAVLLQLIGLLKDVPGSFHLDRAYWERWRWTRNW